MKIIPFDVEYRPEIESGKYTIITENEEPVSILKWNVEGDYPIIALIDDNYSDSFNKKGESRFFNKTLKIVTDVELSPFEKALSNILYQESENADSFDEEDFHLKEYYDVKACEYAKELLKLV